jgi:hypothetical protein
MCIGIVGDAGVRANAQQPKLFVGMILILIFAEALALYGLIGKYSELYGEDHMYCCVYISLFMIAVGIILASKAGSAEPKA